jgi:hypothetical protein
VTLGNGVVKRQPIRLVLVVAVKTGHEGASEFGLLGPLEVRAGDGPLLLGGATQRALLALLLLNANRVLARERLIDELWGEEPPKTAAKAVQGYVWRLRKLLPEGTLLTRPPGYVLEVAPEAVDLRHPGDGSRGGPVLTFCIHGARFRVPNRGLMLPG